ncbi:MAG TPA: heavy metal translocating P-type ATPase [Gemmatimonadales bacterium]|nr:heavy metal translocating P-type ATPase [Gemmatimonadales bacterium]
MIRASRLALARYPVVALAAAGLAGGLTARFVFGAPRVGEWCFFGALAGGGVPLIWQTLRGLARGKFAADVVAALAIGTALALGEYFAGAVIVLMQSGGEALERFAFGRASSALEALLARAPTTAHRLRDGVLTDVPVESVVPGDTLVIRPGDLVPVDAAVEGGTSAVDESAVTGEPLPVRAVPGTELRSGTVNLDGALTVRALRPSADSQYQIIVRLVERARRDRAPIQRLADRYAAWFTPLTLLVCAVAWVASGNPTTVLAVLVVATPCPLILATPVAVIAAVSRAAELGVIVKSGAAIEQLGRARVVVFDKTGTLTLGRPEVHDVRGLNGEDPDRLLRLASGVEQFSAHHFGRAVAAAATARGLSLATGTDVREWPGLGVSGTVDGMAVAVGSAAFFATRGVAVPGRAPERTTAYVMIDGRLAGAITFADLLRPEVPALMRRLAALGVRETVMLTGDRREAADAVAAQAGVRTVRADLLPADKASAVAALQAREGTRPVVMVGDGINDAPALAAATVGVALGAHGTAASAEAADVVLLVDDVGRVGDAFALSRRMRRIALQSIGVGLGVSAALMVVASFGLIRPAVGALLQEALDAAVILNALRARRS